MKNSLYILGTAHKWAGSIPAPGKVAPQGPDRFKVTATLDPQHEIFSGHFPQQPVLPGVCLLDMLKEMIREITGLPYTLTEGKTIKYLKPVDPQDNDAIHFELALKTDGEGLSVTASSYLGDGEVNFKFRGMFSVIS